MNFILQQNYFTNHIEIWKKNPTVHLSMNRFSNENEKNSRVPFSENSPLRRKIILHLRYNVLIGFFFVIFYAIHVIRNIFFVLIKYVQRSVFIVSRLVVGSGIATEAVRGGS